MTKQLFQSAKILMALTSMIILSAFCIHAADSISDASSEDRYRGREITLHELNHIVNKDHAAIPQSRTLQRCVLVEWSKGMLTYDPDSFQKIVYLSGKHKASYRPVTIQRLWGLLRPYEYKLQNCTEQTFRTLVSEDEDSYFDQKFRVINGYDTMILTQLKVAQYFEVLRFARMIDKNAHMFADGDEMVAPTFPSKVIDFIVTESNKGNPYANVLLGTLSGSTVRTDNGIVWLPNENNIIQFYTLAGTKGYGRGYHLLAQHFLQNKEHHLKSMTEIQIYRHGINNLIKSLWLGYAYALPDFGLAIIDLPPTIAAQIKFEGVDKLIALSKTEFAAQGYRPTIEEVFPASHWSKERIG